MDETESYPTTTGDNSILYQAIKDNKLEDVKLILDDKKMSINDPIITTGPYTGFTALHLACMGKDNDNIVKLLVEDYKADVNVMAEDGIQPIHLACFFEADDYATTSWYSCKTNALLKANANPNAEFGREMFLKYVKDKEWCPDFGDKMSLVIYSVIYRKAQSRRYLVDWKVNTEIKSLKTNKTLLMYAIESNQIICARMLATRISDPEYINHRDNDGIPAIQNLFHPKKYGDFRYDEIQSRELLSCGGGLIRSLINSGADIYALINDDPETFLPNVVVYRTYPRVLEELLPYYRSIVHSKALYIATLPVDENSDKYLRLYPRSDGDRYVDISILLEDKRKECTMIILKDLVNRLTFGLPVPVDEKQLMDKLISTDTEIKNIVDNYKRDFIEGKLKKNFIKLSDQTMTAYEFIMQVYDDKKLKILSRDEMLYTAWHTYFKNFYDYDHIAYFNPLVRHRIKSGRQRFELLEKLKKISQLTEAIPLPYKLILDIVEYLPIKDFDNLIKAFVY